MEEFESYIDLLKTCKDLEIEIILFHISCETVVYVI